MNKTRLFLPIFASVALAACTGESDDADADTELEVATTEGEAGALASAVEAGDFMQLQLGPKIVGPQGPEVTGTLSNEAGNFADIRSYVACPADMQTCDPATAPEGTVYTYVHVVTPGSDNNAQTGEGSGASASHVERAFAFMMNRPATGFTGKAGYAQAEARSAMGESGQAIITCEDGKLIWTLDSGDGGDQWEHMEPVTFYWQSTVPPAGPAPAYEIRADYTAATGSGPYPGEAAGASNACMRG